MIISKRFWIGALLVAVVLLAIIFAPSISASTIRRNLKKPLNIFRRSMDCQKKD